jgi:ABC-type multidrug transport system fused ATPase/permease subunit
MGDGEILEFDHPDTLLKNKESHFYKLAHQEFY